MKPTHRLKVLDKSNEGTTDAGAGWLNANGSITIQLNPCVVLKRKKKLVLTLFPENK